MNWEDYKQKCIEELEKFEEFRREKGLARLQLCNDCEKREVNVCSICECNIGSHIMCWHAKCNLDKW